MRQHAHILSSDHGIDMEGSMDMRDQYLSNQAASFSALATQVPSSFLCTFF